jgi:D-serine dehydratase
MRTVASLYGVSLCPHGKTTMAPQIFTRQLGDGAWGITLSTPHQVHAARHYGISRIFFANQILDPHFLRYIIMEQTRDPTFAFYFLLDSAEGAEGEYCGSQRRGGRAPSERSIEPHAGDRTCD